MSGVRFVMFAFVALLSCVAQAKNDQIELIEKSLNSIKTMEAKITQVDSRNDRATGRFYLSKPGDMRIDYKSRKSDISMVAGKTMVTYYDRELDETSYAFTSSTPVAILMQDSIDFADFEIIDINNNGAVYKIVFYKKDKKDEGIFTFTFKAGDPLILQRIDRGDPNNGAARISILFTEVKINTSIDSKVFTIKGKKDY